VGPGDNICQCWHLQDEPCPQEAGCGSPWLRDVAGKPLCLYCSTFAADLRVFLNAGVSQWSCLACRGHLGTWDRFCCCPVQGTAKKWVRSGGTESFGKHKRVLRPRTPAEPLLRPAGGRGLSWPLSHVPQVVLSLPVTSEFPVGMAEALMQNCLWKAAMLTTVSSMHS
jgi:hypothetical protein